MNQIITGCVAGATARADNNHEAALTWLVVLLLARTSAAAIALLEPPSIIGDPWAATRQPLNTGDALAGRQCCSAPP